MVAFLHHMVLLFFLPIFLGVHGEMNYFTRALSPPKWERVTSRG